MWKRPGLVVLRGVYMWGCPSSSECTDCCTGKNHHRTQRSQKTKTNIFFFLSERTFQGENCGCESVCPSCCCLGANPLISCVSMNRYFTRKKREREERGKSFILLACLFDHYKTAPVLLCVVHELIWTICRKTSLLCIQYSVFIRIKVQAKHYTRLFLS